MTPAELAVQKLFPNDPQILTNEEAVQIVDNAIYEAVEGLAEENKRLKARINHLIDQDDKMGKAALHHLKKVEERDDEIRKLKLSLQNEKDRVVSILSSREFLVEEGKQRYLDDCAMAALPALIRAYEADTDRYTIAIGAYNYANQMWEARSRTSSPEKARTE